MTTLDKSRLKYCLVCNKRLDLISKGNMRPIKKSNDVFLKFSTMNNLVTNTCKKIIFKFSLILLSTLPVNKIFIESEQVYEILTKILF